jgi:HD-like signal output (HDOD) protein
LAPVSALASVILQDASMTARLLKLANSIVYNPCATGISTITRAVIVLGFNAVRNMCLTLTLVDDLVKGSAKEHLERELARAMHAATQARALAAARGDKSPEEVFIATLLYRIGELAFWCFGTDDQRDRVERLATQPGVTPETAQERVLGFRLSQLSRRLIHEWQLTELLRDAVDHPARHDPRIRTLMLGQRIAHCAEQHGWRSEDMRQLIQTAARLTELPERDIESLLHQKAREAVSMALDCGADSAARLIPRPGGPDSAAGDTATTSGPAECVEPPPTDTHPGPDPQLEARILRELTSTIESDHGDFNVIMELALEGIHRGVGMDRVIFALTTPDKGVIRVKHALGIPVDEQCQPLVFRRPANGPDVLFQALDQRLARLVTPREREDAPHLVSDELTRLLGVTPFMVAPIIVNQQSIGLFIADRGLSHRPLDAASHEAFKHFARQASLGLTLASVRQRR